MQIMKFLLPRLLNARPQRWPHISEVTGVSVSAIRKIAYRDIRDPGVNTVQPLIDFFNDVRLKRRAMPPLPPNSRLRPYKTRTRKPRPDKAEGPPEQLSA